MATKKPSTAAGSTATASNATTSSGTAGGEVSGAGSAPANIAAATEINPSGAPVQIVPDVDLSHPAVDDNPRRGTSIDQNRIDFNDPTKDGAEAVADSLRKQGMTVSEESTGAQKTD